MEDKERMLVYIPKGKNYIEILGHRIDGFDSFEKFCEHLNKYAELEETVNRQKAEIEEQDQAIINALKRMGQIRAEAITEFEQKVFDLFPADKNHTTISRFTIKQIAKELKGLPTEDNDVKCKDCEYLMFSDCYGECRKAYKGIVNPNDSCGKGKKRVKGEQ